MKSMSTTRPERRQESGFVIITAIFLLVVLAGLAAAMVSMSTSQQLTSAADMQSSRAYWAARSAANYAVMQLLQPEDTSSATTFAACFAVPQAVTLAGFTGFTVKVTQCTRNPATNYNDGGLNVVVYSITAFASYGAVGSPSYVEREVSVSVAKCKDPAAIGDTRLRCL